MFDTAQVGEALRLLADWLRAPTAANEAQARHAIAELQASFGPLVAIDPVRDDDAPREQYRKNAHSAMDDYFRANPIKPMKP